MSKVDFGQATQILANLGVIAGIVFLGIETAQNSAVLESQTRLNIVMIEDELFAMLSQNEDIATAALKAQSGEELSAIEEFQLIAAFQRAYRVSEWIYLEVPDQRPKVAQRRGLLQLPIAREAWNRERGFYDSAYVAFMEEGL